MSPSRANTGESRIGKLGRQFERAGQSLGLYCGEIPESWCLPHCLANRPDSVGFVRPTILSLIPVRYITFGA